MQCIIINAMNEWNDQRGRFNRANTENITTDAGVFLCAQEGIGSGRNHAALSPHHHHHHHHLHRRLHIYCSYLKQLKDLNFNVGPILVLPGCFGLGWVSTQPNVHSSPAHGQSCAMM